MRIVGTFAETRDLGVGVVGLVPTMGFLHEGHLAHMHRARRECDSLVVSLFVNPLQFTDDLDLAGYPRDLDRDARLVEATGADVLFAPDSEEMYPQPPETRVSVPALSTSMEGGYRAGHFEGVATVVAKFFAGLRPDRAYFGRKDAQQLAIVKQMAADLSFPVEIIPGSTVREADGLALSSRNVFLSPDERRAARGISAGLLKAADAAEAGERDAGALETIVLGHLQAIEVDYVEMADAERAERRARLTSTSFLAVAARVGNTRLIDNVFLEVSGADVVADRGIRLERPSMLYESGYS